MDSKKEELSAGWASAMRERWVLDASGDERYPAAVVETNRNIAVIGRGPRDIMLHVVRLHNDALVDSLVSAEA